MNNRGGFSGRGKNAPFRNSGRGGKGNFQNTLQSVQNDGNNRPRAVHVQASKGNFQNTLQSLQNAGNIRPRAIPQVQPAQNFNTLQFTGNRTLTASTSFPSFMGQQSTGLNKEQFSNSTNNFGLVPASLRNFTPLPKPSETLQISIRNDIFGNLPQGGMQLKPQVALPSFRRDIPPPPFRNDDRIQPGNNFQSSFNPTNQFPLSNTKPVFPILQENNKPAVNSPKSILKKREDNSQSFVAPTPVPAPAPSSQWKVLSDILQDLDKNRNEEEPPFFNDNFPGNLSPKRDFNDFNLRQDKPNSDNFGRNWNNEETPFRRQETGIDTDFPERRPDADIFIRDDRERENFERERSFSPEEIDTFSNKKRDRSPYSEISSNSGGDLMGSRAELEDISEDELRVSPPRRMRSHDRHSDSSYKRRRSSERSPDRKRNRPGRFDDISPPRRSRRDRYESPRRRSVSRDDNKRHFFSPPRNEVDQLEEEVYFSRKEIDVLREEVEMLRDGLREPVGHSRIPKGENRKYKEQASADDLIQKLMEPLASANKEANKQAQQVNDLVKVIGLSSDVAELLKERIVQKDMKLNAAKVKVFTELLSRLQGRPIPIPRPDKDSQKSPLKVDSRRSGSRKTSRISPSRKRTNRLSPSINRKQADKHLRPADSSQVSPSSWEQQNVAPFTPYQQSTEAILAQTQFPPPPIPTSQTFPPPSSRHIPPPFNVQQFPPFTTQYTTPFNDAPLAFNVQWQPPTINTSVPPPVNTSVPPPMTFPAHAPQPVVMPDVQALQRKGNQMRKKSSNMVSMPSNLKSIPLETSVAVTSPQPVQIVNVQNITTSNKFTAKETVKPRRPEEIQTLMKKKVSVEISIAKLEVDLKNLNKPSKNSKDEGKRKSIETVTNQLKKQRDFLMRIDKELEAQKTLKRIMEEQLKTANSVLNLKNDLTGGRKEKVEEPLREEDKVIRKLFDGGWHFCKECELAFTTLPEILAHLHSENHKQNVPAEKPWRALRNRLETEVVSAKLKMRFDTPTISVPAKGAEYLSSCQGFYCQLCEVFLGDSDWAEHHLLSDAHYLMYEKVHQEFKQENKEEPVSSAAQEVKDEKSKIQKPSATTQDKSNSKETGKSSQASVKGCKQSEIKTRVENANASIENETKKVKTQSGEVNKKYIDVKQDESLELHEPSHVPESQDKSSSEKGKITINLSSKGKETAKSISTDSSAETKKKEGKKENLEEDDVSMVTLDEEDCDKESSNNSMFVSTDSVAGQAFVKSMLEEVNETGKVTVDNESSVKKSCESEIENGVSNKGVEAESALQVGGNSCEINVSKIDDNKETADIVGEPISVLGLRGRGSVNKAVLPPGTSSASDINSGSDITRAVVKPPPKIAAAVDSPCSNKKVVSAASVKDMYDIYSQEPKAKAKEPEHKISAEDNQMSAKKDECDNQKEKSDKTYTNPEKEIINKSNDKQEGDIKEDNIKKKRTISSEESSSGELSKDSDAQHATASDSHGEDAKGQNLRRSRRNRKQVVSAEPVRRSSRRKQSFVAENVETSDAERDDKNKKAEFSESVADEEDLQQSETEAAQETETEVTEAAETEEEMEGGQEEYEEVEGEENEEVEENVEYEEENEIEVEEEENGEEEGGECVEEGFEGGEDCEEEYEEVEEVVCEEEEECEVEQEECEVEQEDVEDDVCAESEEYDGDEKLENQEEGGDADVPEDLIVLDEMDDDIDEENSQA